MAGVEGMGQGGRAMVGKRSGEAVRWIGGRWGVGSGAAGRGDRVAQRMFTSQDFQVSSTHAMCRHTGACRARRTAPPDQLRRATRLRFLAGALLPTVVDAE